MKMIRRISIGLGLGIASTCLVAILLFNWSVTGWKALTVPTGSMRPRINPGSLVLVHSVPNSSLHIGDVITYANPSQKGSTISHRIIKTYLLNGKIPAYITKGDANPSADIPVVGGQVQGKVMLSIPYVGSWLKWTHTLVGILIAIYIPALIIMIQEMRRLAAYYKQLVPYKAAQVLAREKALAKAGRGKYKIMAIPGIAMALLAASVLFAFPVQALLKSNTVALVNNSITVAAVTPPVNTCNGNNTSTTVNTGGNSGSSNNNNVNVSTSTTQTATTGDATNTGNTNGGSATSGDATNCNSTNININIH